MVGSKFSTHQQHGAQFSDIVVINDSGGDNCAKRNNQPAPSSAAKAKKRLAISKHGILFQNLSFRAWKRIRPRKKVSNSKGPRKRKSLVPYHYDGDRNDAAVYSKVRKSKKCDAARR